MSPRITTAAELLEARHIGRCELVRGELRSMIPPGYEHGRIAYELGFRIGEFVRSRRLGTIVAAETGFLLAREPDTVRAPDIAFIREERAQGPSRGYYPGAPDLAVEVLSPDDRPGYVRERVAEWLEAGTRAVWVVDPKSRTLTVHELGAEPRLVDRADILAGGDILPGFELAIHEIFA